jgi:peptidoglycan/LPS O-acetylase OafA/YrhL
MLGRWLDVQRIEERTPPDRDRVADLLRVVAIVLVVVGHWLVAVVLHRDGELVAGQVLQHVPATRALTWVFQVMPLFFFVGGALNVASWRRARDEGDPWARWLRRRVRRLLTPALPLLALWTAIVALAEPLPLPTELVALAAETALLPLWFLVVYALVIALVPWTEALHVRAGLWVPAVAIALTGVTDVLDRLEVPLVGFVSYLLLWGGVHQLGYRWADDRLPRPRAALAIGAAAVAVALALIGGLGYPGSMVAVYGAELQNTDPPSLALWAYAIAQISLVVAVRHRLARVLERPRVWAPVAVAGSAMLTLFLWHMTAMVAVAAAVHPTGVWPRLDRIDATWWAMRPVWLLLCLLALAAVVAPAHRFERQPDPVPRDGPVRAGAGVVVFAAGMGMLMTDGLHAPEGPLGLHLVPLAAVLVGLALLGALRPRRWLPEVD